MLFAVAAGAEEGSQAGRHFVLDECDKMLESVGKSVLAIICW